jgi:regulator of protease activity HflC (stomatin/prohibitin superfamily)
MNIVRQKIERIRNLKRFALQSDFTYNAFSYFVLGVFLVAGLLAQFWIQPGTDPVETVYVAVGAVVGGLFLTAVSLWAVAIQLVVVGGLAMLAFLDGSYTPLFVGIALGFIVSPSLELVYQWDKVVVLRLGRFHKVHGPGLFVLIPLIDRVADFVDTRIRATDFSAEKTLTKDTVPVHVDALAFWMIWDAQRAVLEVENFMEAVVLSAQTALRDSIGRHDLATLLSEREELGNAIQQTLDAKTNPWGISILSVEITDIIIPRELEDAMSKVAQAERERKSRVILGTAEVEIAEKFEEASVRYKDNPTALQLRAMNMIYEGLRQKGSLVLLPASALESMNLGTVMGTMALQKGGIETAAPGDAAARGWRPPTGGAAPGGAGRGGAATGGAAAREAAGRGGAASPEGGASAGGAANSAGDDEPDKP